MIDALSGIRSIGGTSSLGGIGRAAPAAASAAGGDFSQVFADVSSNAVGALKTGEATAISGIDGKASVQQVVQAIMSAEETLQAAIAVRDKIVAAYQEVTRMAI